MAYKLSTDLRIPRLSDDEKARRASPGESTSRGDDSFGPRLPLHPSGLPVTHWRPRINSVHVPSGQLSRQRTDRIVLWSFEGLFRQPFVRVNRGGPRDGQGLHQLLQLRTRSMEPKKDDPKTISGPSDRSIENVVFLLNCPFYGAQFSDSKRLLFSHFIQLKSKSYFTQRTSRHHFRVVLSGVTLSPIIGVRTGISSRFASLSNRSTGSNHA